MLTKISTKELVEELSKREGVESIDVPVEGQDEIAVETYKNKPTTISTKENYIYDSTQDGPAIILRIID